MKLPHEFRSLRKSFLFAGRGIWSCVRNERNMRIHLTATVLVLCFSAVYGVSRTEMIALCFAFGFVISAEMFNTALEVLVNLESPSYHMMARVAKDVAAGAVLVAALTSVAIGALVFFHADRLSAAFSYLTAHPLCFAGMLLLAAAGLWFIFRFPHKKQD